MATPLKVHGADISHYQTSVDLVKAKKAGLKFLFHKATEGDSITDDKYKSRRTLAKSAGLPFGAYHFARPERGDAESEARRFLAFADPKPGDLRPALDLETDEGLSLSALRTWADTWCDVVAKAIGVQPMIYSPYDLGLAQKGRLRWRARYNNDNRRPDLPYDIWQFSNGVFGVPNSFPGLGHCDLDTLAAGVTLTDLLIPMPKPEPTMVRLNLMHASLQFSDSPAHHTADLEKIFARAVKRKVAWITGTEAGPGANNTSDELVRIGNDSGYRMWVPSAASHKQEGWATDCWVGVRKDLVDGNWTKDYVGVIPGSSELYAKQGLPRDTDPRWGPKGIVSVGFDNDTLGHIDVSATHFLTKGRSEKGQPIKGVDHYKWNQTLGHAVGQHMVEQGKGSALAFHGSDTNIVDRVDDAFFGEPVTTIWDELQNWDNTGHGNIDVIVTLDKDHRVHGAYIRALDDEEFPLNLDHFLVEAGVDIRPLKG